MYSYVYILHVIYSVEIVIGVLGNGLLLYLYTFRLITAHKMRPIDLIVINLAFSNTLLILIRGVPWAIQLLQLKIVLNDIGCDFIIYLQGVSWRLSLCCTCFLSVFRAITISSSNIRCTELKVRAPKCVIPCCVSSWILILLLGVTVFFDATNSRNNTNSKQNSYLEFCSLNRHTLNISRFAIWKSLHEGVYVGSMVITSGYMVLILYRHHKQVQNIFGITFTLRASPEIKATKIILLLLSIFVYFYSVSLIFIIYMYIYQDTKEWVLYVSVLLILCYPTISPFVLISSDSKIPMYLCLFKGIKNLAPNHQLLRPNLIDS